MFPKMESVVPQCALLLLYQLHCSSVFQERTGQSLPWLKLMWQLSWQSPSLGIARTPPKLSSSFNLPHRVCELRPAALEMGQNREKHSGDIKSVECFLTWSLFLEKSRAVEKCRKFNTLKNTVWRASIPHMVTGAEAGHTFLFVCACAQVYHTVLRSI